MPTWHRSSGKEERTKDQPSSSWRVSFQDELFALSLGRERKERSSIWGPKMLIYLPVSSVTSS